MLFRGPRKLRLTITGRWFVALTILLGVAAIMVGNNVFYLLESFLLGAMILSGVLSEITIATGRTHQIRVHCLHAGHPIACDPKYGDADFDAAMRQKGLNRLFLHARSISLLHPATEERVTFTAPLDDTLSNTLKAL